MAQTTNESRVSSTKTANGSLPRPLIEVGIFEDVETARKAIVDLLTACFTVDEITVVCSDKSKAEFFRPFEHQESAGSHAIQAAAGGGAVGALLASAIAVTATALTGGVAGAVMWVAGALAAGGGAVAGGLIGAMATRGVEKEAANFYQQAVLEGDILIAVEPKARAAADLVKAAEIFATAGAQPLTMHEG